MANSDKKGHDKKNAAAESASSTAQNKDNLFSRLGNQQIQDSAQKMTSVDKVPETVLTAAMANESEYQVEQQWWRDESVASSAMEQEEESSSIAGQQDEQTKAEADKDAARGRKLAPQEEMALLASKKQAISGGELQEQEKQVLKDADAAGMSEEEKAMMLVKQGSVDQEVLDEQTGAVQAMVAAEQMPDVLAGFHRDAARETSKTPLGERDTIRNVTEEIRLISKQFQKHEKLSDPNLSIEEKATALVDLLAYELDVPTRESVAAHPYMGLHEDLIFDPQALLAINTIAGSSREVRTLGSFAIVAWQLAVDTVRNQLAGMDDKDMIQEDSMWQDCLGQLANKMYVDALMKPSPLAS